MFTKFAEIIGTSPNYESLYKPVLEKYGIRTQYDLTHCIYREDFDQIRKDLLKALAEKMGLQEAM